MFDKFVFLIVHAVHYSMKCKFSNLNYTSLQHVVIKKNHFHITYLPLVNHSGNALICQTIFLSSSFQSDIACLKSLEMEGDKVEAGGLESSLIQIIQEHQQKAVHIQDQAGQFLR